MTRVRLRKGLTIPIAGAPEPRIADAPAVEHVALLGRDHPGLRPRMLVEAGQRVRCGEPLVEDRRMEGVVLTAPAGGVVTEIVRGPRRRLERIAIRVDGDESVRFDVPVSDRLERRDVADLLLRSGLWTALRTRPFERVPAPDTAPASLFVTAMDTRPLAPSVEAILAAEGDPFRVGVRTLSRLTTGRVFVCCAPDASLPPLDASQVEVVAFDGPHPAGLVGTHVHHLDPVGARRTVWHVGYQDVIAIGRLVLGGRVSVERVVALAGPALARPRLVRTRLGASLGELLAGELAPGLDRSDVRVVSGGVLYGDHATDPDAFLGRYHDQVAVLPEGTTTASHGTPTALVPTDAYERVLPMDILALPLLRALQVGDLEQAEALGCLELAEEDVALLTYVCPAKTDHGPALRAALDALARDR